jgi:hypothetical protein
VSQFIPDQNATKNESETFQNRSEIIPESIGMNLSRVFNRIHESNVLLWSEYPVQIVHESVSYTGCGGIGPNLGYLAGNKFHTF